MRPNADLEHVARAALALAGVPAAQQAAIVDMLYMRLDRDEALARRDRAIRDAHNIVGNVRDLTRALHTFHARAWPLLRHLPSPPPEESPLRRACFFACMAATDAGLSGMPGERHIRRIIF